MRNSLTVLATALLLAAAPAQAADAGFYLGAGVGQMNTEVDDVFGSAFDFDEDDVGFKLFGGYRFLPWLSVEGMFVDGGNPEIRATSGDEAVRLAIEIRSLAAAAVFALPVGERAELFVKPGVAYWESTTVLGYSSPAFSDRIDDDDSGSAFFVGAGGGLEITENLGVRLEYEWFEVAPEWDSEEEEFIDELEASAGFLSLSFLYRF